MRNSINDRYMKIIVFDDDPTGSQTVNDCLLLLKWDYQTLLKGLQSKSNILFILANTRSLSEIEAKQRLNEICQALLDVFCKNGYKKEDFIFVSRGDSTLRGHNYLEPYMLNKILGPFDATFHLPAFIEGDRVTIDGKHFVNDVPAHKTIYARDKVFGYKTNNIKEILYIKSKSMILFDDIKNLYLSDLDVLEMKENNEVLNKIYSLKNNIQVIVDATEYKHLDKIAALGKFSFGEKRFLYRTAASFLTAISGSKGVIPSSLLFSTPQRRNSNNQIMKGLYVVGSFVQNTNDQLKKILEIESCKAVELDVFQFYRINFSQGNDYDLLKFRKSLINKVRICLKNSYTPILFTSRNEVLSEKHCDQMFFYNSLAKFIAELVGELKYEIGYLVSKGGITSNTILSHGLRLDSVYLKGQILKGISVVEAKLSNSKGVLPVVTFPGNIGNKYSLLELWEIFEKTD